VQQQSGVQLPGGVGTAGDRHEQHADAVAERVVQGRSSEDLLTQYTGKRNHPDDRGNRAHPSRCRLRDALRKVPGHDLRKPRTTPTFLSSLN
jgi:hypothetical protein